MGQQVLVRCKQIIKGYGRDIIFIVRVLKEPRCEGNKIIIIEPHDLFA